MAAFTEEKFQPAFSLQMFAASNNNDMKTKQPSTFERFRENRKKDYITDLMFAGGLCAAFFTIFSVF
jgi:hypothetical protein